MIYNHTWLRQGNMSVKLSPRGRNTCGGERNAGFGIEMYWSWWKKKVNGDVSIWVASSEESQRQIIIRTLGRVLFHLQKMFQKIVINEEKNIILERVKNKERNFRELVGWRIPHMEKTLINGEGNFYNGTDFRSFSACRLFTFKKRHKSSARNIRKNIEIRKSFNNHKAVSQDPLALSHVTILE